MKTVSLISPEEIDVLRCDVQHAEQLGELTASQLNIIYREKWFNMYVPPAYGGLGLDLPSAVQLIEKLAWVDGSIGWVVTLCSGANLFIGYLDNTQLPLFFSDDKACFAGSGASTGTARAVKDGYIINGKWKYATGSAHATAFTANCLITDEEGLTKPETSSFIFKSDAITIGKDWNGIGMKATSSNSFYVNNLFVPAETKFTIGADHSVFPDPIFHFPFLQFAEVTLAANLLGMAIHYTEECRKLLENRIICKTLPVEQSCEILELLGRSLSGIEKSKDIFYDNMISAWESGKIEKKWEPGVLEKLSFNSKKMVKELLMIVDKLYPYCGMEGADQRSAINRIWRDIHTASQHQLVSFKQPITVCR